MNMIESLEKPVLPVKYVSRGVALLVDGEIWLHKDLAKKEFQYLQECLMKHEFGHLSTLDIPLKDVLYDFKDGFNGNLSKELLKFMWNRPSTWWQLLPIKPLGNGVLGVDKTHILIMVILIALIGGITLAYILVKGGVI